VKSASDIFLSWPNPGLESKNKIATQISLLVIEVSLLRFIHQRFKGPQLSFVTVEVSNTGTALLAVTGSPPTRPFPLFLLHPANIGVAKGPRSLSE
jgi:hypothetical protein